MFQAIIMQAERIKICSNSLLRKGCSGSWFIPVDVNASVHDILAQFAIFISNGSTTHIDSFPIIKTCFEVLLRENSECMFVFMRRDQPEVAGILRSNKPLMTPREQQLVRIVECQRPWNLPLWTWTEHDMALLESMEKQCRQRNIRGPCVGVWCYR